MLRFNHAVVIAVFCASVALVMLPARAYDTAGVVVAPTGFNHPDLVSASWKVRVPQYMSSEVLRIEFNAIKFEGSTNELVVQWMHMNLCHDFVENDVISWSNTQFFAGFSTYLSTQRPDLAEGVVRLSDPAVSPKYKRAFNDIDGSGVVGVSIFSTQPMREPSPDQPVDIVWNVRRGDSVVNPIGQFAKDLAGNWTPLVGTYREWFFNVAVDGAAQDVAKYLIPIEYGERISSWQPFVLAQEFFGADTGRMGDVQTEARFYDFITTDASGQDFLITDWQTAGCIDREIPDVWAAKDKRFGWYTDGSYLVSTSGHAQDIAIATREVGQALVLAVPEPSTGFVLLALGTLVLVRRRPQHRGSPSLTLISAKH